jgi:uncharacterized protein
MKKTKRFVWMLVAVALAVFLVVGIVEPLEVTRYDVNGNNIPTSFDGYRILQIADLQNSTDSAILKYARELKPDLIVFSGDNFYTVVSHQTEDWTLSLVYQLSEIAPVYAVSGNHDVWNVDFKKNQLLLANAGAILLENATRTIQRGGDSITISGIADPYVFDIPEATARIRQYMKDVPSTPGYDILLFHRANFLDMMSGQGFELVFSGHLHGGQICLPFLHGGLISPEGGLFPKYICGMYAIDPKCTAVVSRGIGNTAIVPRIYDPPELVLVTLHKTP